MSAGNYTVFNAMTDIIASPSKAFDEIRSHTSWLWWPLLLNLLLGLGMFVYYYSWVDFTWLVEETIRSVPPESRAESADQIRNFMTPKGSMMVSLVFILVFTFVMYLLQAVYLNLANKLMAGASIKFGQWFSFASWTNFVGIFATIAGFIVIFLADNNQLGSTDLQPLSLNSLLVHGKPGEAWTTWASSLNLLSIWTVFLTALGFRRWTGSSSMKSWVVALIPWVLIFGIWAAMILR